MAKVATSRGWQKLSSRARWGLIALAVVNALGWPPAPAARVDLVANRVGRAAPNTRVAGIPVAEVHFSATDGARLGELLALTWRNVSLERGYIQIQMSARRFSDKGVTIKDAKTGRSRRKIELSETAIAALRPIGRARLKNAYAMLARGAILIWSSQRATVPQSPSPTSIKNTGGSFHLQRCPIYALMICATPQRRSCS